MENIYFPICVYWTTKYSTWSTTSTQVLRATKLACELTRVQFLTGMGILAGYRKLHLLT